MFSEARTRTIASDARLCTPSSGESRHARLVDDEQSRAELCRRAMRLGIVCHLVTHAWPQHELAAVLELGVQLAFDAKQDVALTAPMIRQVARRVLDHSHPNAAELPRAPVRHASVAGVLGRLDRRPVCRAK